MSESPPPIRISAPWLVRVISRRLLWFFVDGGFFFFGRTKAVAGTEHLDGLDRVVLVSNHHSIFDTPFIVLSMPKRLRRRLSPVGGLDFFQPQPEHPLWVRLWRHSTILFMRGSLNVALIDRNRGQYSELDRLDALIAGGWSLLIFPEATRSRTGRMGRFHHGAAELARRHQVPVVPIHIEGSQHVLGVGMRWPRSGDVMIRVGAPILPNSVDSTAALTQAIRAAVEALGEKSS